jgi:tetratricopeptide (TPR) repeat protein
MFISIRKIMRYYIIALSYLTLFFAVCAYSQESTTSRPASSQQQKKDDAARATEESSSRDTRIDLSPPKNDAKNHPMSSTNPNETDQPSSDDVDELHPWDPHKAAKDVEVGDFYFRRKNYKAAIERYRDALIYKQNDAVANFRLAESLDKTGNSSEAIEHYQEYLKILPHGPSSEDAQKALARLSPNTKSSASK